MDERSNFDVTSNDLNARLDTWIWASHRLNKIENAITFVPFIQMLGVYDKQLIEFDRIIIQPNFSGSLSDHFEFSRLWIFGCYEITRAIYDRCRRKKPKNKPQFLNYPKCSSDELDSEVLETKNYIGRLRMPLAKFEAAWGHESDLSDPPYYIVSNVGAGWILSHKDAISRRQISDKFLTLLLKISDNNFLEK